MTGLLTRHLINSYLHIDVFKNYLHAISIVYYLFMSVITCATHGMMEGQSSLMYVGANSAGYNAPAGNYTGGNAPAGNSTGGNYTGGNAPSNNSPAGHQRAGGINGPIQVEDPNGQNYVYNHGGTNQPLLGNIARALDHQSIIGLWSLSRDTFTLEQEMFILKCLYYEDRALYNRIMYKYDRIKVPSWRATSNNRHFRDLLRNAD